MKANYDALWEQAETTADRRSALWEPNALWELNALWERVSKVAEPLKNDLLNYMKRTV
jgi:hypothetical protein